MQETEYPDNFFRNCTVTLLNRMSETYKTVRLFEYMLVFFLISSSFYKKKYALRLQGPCLTINNLFWRSSFGGSMNIIYMKIIYE